MFVHKFSVPIFVSIATSVAIVIGTSSCGKTAFMPVASNQSSQSPGSFYEPPKVDILLAEDDSGSIQNIYSQISQQMPAFLTQLQSENWDYHFAVTPLTSTRTMTQVAASNYDIGWGTSWQPPFPGAVAANLENVVSSFFRLPTVYSGFLTRGETSNAQSGSEPGLQTIAHALNVDSQGTGFIRPDSLLVVLVVGNGNDTSQVSMCQQVEGDGNPNNPSNLVTVPCESVPDCSQLKGVSFPYCSTAATRTAASSLSGFISQIGSAKIDSSYVKAGVSANKTASSVLFYDAEALNAESNCLGARAYAGTRYQQVASALKGQSFDICSNSVSSILASLGTNLQGVRLAFETDYLFISSDANVSTIQVTKISGGSSQSILQDPTNGWTYVGMQNNICTVKSPTGQCMSSGSGFAVELHGTAVLTGNDTAKVVFTPAGFQNSSN